MERKLQEGEISIQVSDGDSCEKVISVEIARQRFEDEKAHVLLQMVKEVSLPGFRKGKAPVNLVESRFSSEIRSEALKSILPLAYSHIVTSEKLDPVGDPEFHEVNLEGDKPLTFKLRIEVFPRIELAEYRNVPVPMEEISVDDKEVEEVLGNLRERSADYEPVDRPAAAGDVVTIDFAPVGPDGAPNEKQRTKNYPVQLGAGQIFPAFEQALTGRPKGETGRIDIEYPMDFKPERLAGSSVTYEFAVIEVREKRLPELDDGFASRMDERFSTLGELREDVRRRLTAEKEKEARHRREERAVDLLIERHQFDVPRTMRERFKQELSDEDERRRKAVGVGSEEDPERRRQIDELFERIAVRNIKRYFIMEHIAAKERIEVSDGDIDAEMASAAAESGRTVEELRGLLAKDSERIASLRTRIRERRIFEVILGAP